MSADAVGLTAAAAVDTTAPRSSEALLCVLDWDADSLWLADSLWDADSLVEADALVEPLVEIESLVLCDADSEVESDSDSDPESLVAAALPGVRVALPSVASVFRLAAVTS